MAFVVRAALNVTERSVTLASHQHQGHQLALAAEGALQIETSAGAWTAPSGQAIWVPCGVEHAERTLAGSRIVTLWLHPSPADPTADACRTLATSALLRELILEVGRRGSLDADVPEQDRLAHVLADQIRAQDEAPLALPRPSDPRALRLAQLVEDAPGDHTSLDDLSTRAGASRRTMERLFLAELGISLGEWRQRLRLHHALGLLAQPHPITDIARACGYAGSTAFIVAFRRHFGVTPHQYRLR